jgi:hypothetical protein
MFLDLSMGEIRKLGAYRKFPHFLAVLVLGVIEKVMLVPKLQDYLAWF